ncbi:hypothetical protein RB595_006935 [Gaeumannomyces hyphopodioides]
MIGCAVILRYRGTDADVDAETSLVRAWKQTRESFPSLAAVADPASREIVVSTNVGPEAVQEWARRSFRVHEGVTADELFTSFRSQFHITLHFLRDRNQLLIQAPHVLLDGRGVLHLYHCLFSALSSGEQQTGGGPVTRLALAPNLSRSYDDWLDLAAVPSAKNMRDAESIFQRILGQEKPIQLPDVDFGRTPAMPAHRELAFGEETTRAVIQACKQKGVSVMAAGHAALAKATQHLQSSAGDQGSTFVQFTTIDLRRWFRRPDFDAQQHSLASLQTALPLVANLEGDGGSFERLSQSLHQQYLAPFAFADQDLGYLGPYMAASRQILESGGVPPSSAPSVVSVGVVDRFLSARYGDWELGDDFWITVTMQTGDIQMYSWTWKGRLVLSVCYNEAFYAVDRVDELLLRTRWELLQGLGISI